MPVAFNWVRRKTCTGCGNPYKTASGKSTFCADCRPTLGKEAKAEYDREYKARAKRRIA